MTEMILPRAVKQALDILENAGYEAFLVGGCVRDHLMGMQANDFDITTSALPEETKACFEGFHVIETGLQHGTVTVVIDREPLEITTYRIDGEYEDHRHPTQVTFTRNLEEDLSRRDFTVNAMAYSPTRGLIDPFGGQDDLQKQCIRCVGEAKKRFDEDALRILRALRFAAKLGFAIDGDTDIAIHAQKDTLSHVSAERIYAEFTKLLIGKNAVEVLRDYPDVIGVFISEILPCVGFDQHNRHHAFDVYGHTLEVVRHTEPILPLRMAAFLHDIAKPQTAAWAEDGMMHFYKHPAIGAQMAKEILQRLRADNATIELVAKLITHHDDRVPAQRPAVKRLLRRFSYEEVPLWISLQKADALGHNAEFCTERIARLEKIECLIEELKAENACIKTSDLAINGRHLMALGLKGKQIGDMLSFLLEAVTDETLPNEKEQLLAFASKQEILTFIQK